MTTLRVLVLLFCMIRAPAYRDSLMPEKQFSGSHYVHQVQKLQAFKESFAQRHSMSSSPVSDTQGSSRVFHVTSYGADPSGKNDSTNEILKAISDAVQDPGNGDLYKGIVNLGGVRINLDGGNYKISRPLRLPVAGRGNLMIHGGTLTASESFPTDDYLIDLSDPSSSGLEYNYEFVTLKDLMLDSKFRGGGIQVIKSLRTGIDNCYITHFNTYGIFVQGGHETYIRNSFLGQHITAGGDPGERSFSGTAISLNGNDNAVTDVVIFSAATGILISGPANTISGVHCYNKATGFGGTGIYLKLPGLTQTRIINSYFDYTGIVAEDPVQLHISSSFFLGDAFILLKSINGVARGVNVVDNMFSGSGKGVNIVQLDERNGNFNDIDQVVVDRNNARGMNVKATVAIGTKNGNDAEDTSWIVDLNQELLFPNRIKSVHYSLIAGGDTFPNHALRNVSDNRIVVESNVPVRANITVIVDQFNSCGIFVQGGHETHIQNSFLGQHITAGGDPGEKSFSGTAISLNGNDNAATNVVIFSAETGIFISCPANTISGVHCYSKATGSGCAGIYQKLPDQLVSC